MAVSSGTRLGPYEILAPLGVGGMGEVYRARDMRLGREVAIKVLPAELADDADRLKRFEKEARSASSLNHPNIVTIHEIERIDSTSFIVMELIEGKTLRELLANGPLPTRRLLTIGVQIGEGLARAHSSGIVHRDLKPENVMVTKDGLVKILDFGLAKLSHPELQEGQSTRIPTVSAGTSPGIVMGTVGYMSPEQASGHPVDFRSDQFSFGSILYETATGKQPFKRATAAQTLAAIIQEEPEAIAVSAPQNPAPVRWLIERCLAKEPKERYASTDDLARDLQGLREHVSEISSSGDASLLAPSRRGARFARAMVAIAVLAALAAGYLATRSVRSPTPPSFQKLTFRRGIIQTARFAPDGQTIVYSAEWEGDPPQLFSTTTGAFESRSLGIDRSNLCAISSAGEMALLLDVAPGMNAGVLARAPLAGGQPRELYENVQSADWSPDGKDLALIRDVANRCRLEYPPGKVLYEIPSSGQLTDARFSPGGREIAFIEFLDRTASLGSVGVVSLSGRKRTLTSHPYTNLWGMAWSGDGKAIWFSGSRDDETRSSLYLATGAGKERRIYASPVSVRLLDVARDGRLLVASIHHGSAINALAPGDERERDLSWLDGSCAAGLSGDGKKLLISETKTVDETVYIRGMDGSPAKRLGDGFGFALSPDAKWAATLGADGHLVLLPTGTGTARTLSVPAGALVINARYFPDGESLLLVAAEKGRSSRLYVAPINGSSWRPISGDGIDAYGLSVSPDGNVATGVGPDRLPRIYPIAGRNARPVPGAQVGDLPIRFSADGKLLYVMQLRLKSVAVDRIELLSGRRESWKELAPNDPSGITPSRCVQVTSDGSAYAYTYHRRLDDLFVLTGLN